MSRLFRLFIVFLLLFSLVPTNVMAADSVANPVEPALIQPGLEELVAAPVVVEQTPTNDTPPVENVVIAALPVEVPSIPPKAAVAAAPSVVTVPDLPALADVLISAVKLTADKNVDAFEIKNTTTKPVNMSGWHIDIARYNVTDEAICRVELTGYILASRAITFGTAAESNANDAIYPFGECAPAPAIVSDVTVRVYQNEMLVEEVRPALSAGPFERRGFTDTYRKGVFITDFKVMTRAFMTSQLYVPKQSIPVKITEINANPTPCMPGDENLACYDYVKLHNPSDQVVVLNELRLRVGQVTQSSTASNTYSLAGVLLPGETKAVALSAESARLSIPNISGTAWLQDSVGLIDYPSGVTPYEKGDLVATSGKSWAYDELDGTWKWGVASPYGGNTFIVAEPGMGSVGSSESTLKPCREDQYRSEETNRCRNISAVTGLTPCKDGQYRSEETNRCRSIALAGSTLQPCKEDQYRSEETNRCRNLTTASANLKPCSDNQYRSEETNRCRNIIATSAPAAAFAVEPVKEGAKAFIGWWALGGIVIAALGYAGWEWRKEITSASRKVFSLRIFK